MAQISNFPPRANEKLSREGIPAIYSSAPLGNWRTARNERQWLLKLPNESRTRSATDTSKQTTSASKPTQCLPLQVPGTA